MQSRGLRLAACCLRRRKLCCCCPSSTICKPLPFTTSLTPPCIHPQVTREELEGAAAALGTFGSDNRAGIAGTLHRISAIRNRRGGVVGLTCRVGRAVTGHVDMIRDILNGGCGCFCQQHCKTKLRCSLLPRPLSPPSQKNGNFQTPFSPCS